MKIIWTRHAAERQQEWEKKLGITRSEVEAVIVNPEQILAGDSGTWIAQSRHGDGLLRIPFAQEEETRKILTVYWTSKLGKYWRGE